MSGLFELHIDDPRAVPMAIDIFRSARPLIFLQMPSVYTLIAPPTRDGVAMLDQAKLRLPSKSYGSAIGSVQEFHSLAEPNAWPDSLSTPEQLSHLEGAFIRLHVARPVFSSSVVRDGTHQGLLLPQGQHRELFSILEVQTLNNQETALFDGKRYAAPLCTSANLSGDPLGSITDETRALNFAKDRELKLWIRCDSTKSAPGSYPIFYFVNNSVSVERNGPEKDRILSSIPESIERVTR